MRVVSAESTTLAIHGGRPVRDTLLPYARQSIDDDDVRAVVDVLRSEWLTTGPKVAEFEEAFAGFVGAKHAVSFSSGTAALHAAVFAAGLGSNDEGITSPITFAATANCLLYQGATPVFADVRSDTLNIDVEQVLRRLTPRTKALLPVDYAGHPADLSPLLEIAERHGLTVIEDACHGLGAKYRGRPVGSISQMSVFSFHPAKHITTGEGGMVTTDDGQFARQLRLFRSHGIDSDARLRQANGQWHYEMVALGYNYRLTDLACALGLSQLRRIETNLRRREEIAARYGEAFAQVPGIILPPIHAEVTHAWHLYPIRVDSAQVSAGRAELFRALRAEGIGVNVHFIPVHLHPYYRKRLGHQPGECPVAEAAYEQLISLPIFQGMTDKDIDDVVVAVRKVFGFFAAHAC